MLTITVPGVEYWDSEKEVFIVRDEIVLGLEHSLITLSKWEEKYEKAYLAPEKHTTEEVLGYVEAMCVTQDLTPEVLTRLSEENFEAISAYINRKASATFFSDVMPGKRSSEIITSELVYYWLSAFRIDFDPVENWHLNRLFNLLRVASVKNAPEKKKSRHQTAQDQKALNEKRLKELGLEDG